jgi:hypothetical protein
MTDSIALGVNGLSIPPGSHICAFFRGVSERDEIVVPFLRGHESSPRPIPRATASSVICTTARSSGS